MATPAIGILGTVLWIGFYAAVIVGTCQKQKLEEDLANKPTESSNHAMQPTRWTALAGALLRQTWSRGSFQLCFPRFEANNHERNLG